MTPRSLSPGQLRGLLKVGDLLIPGDEALPSFSGSRCAEQVDRIVPYLSEADRKGLRLLLGVFLHAPRVLLRGLFVLAERSRGRGPVAAGLRMLWIGVKGLVMTLYYSDVGEGISVHRVIGWDATIVEPGAPAQEES